RSAGTYQASPRTSRIRGIQPGHALDAHPRSSVPSPIPVVASQSPDVTPLLREGARCCAECSGQSDEQTGKPLLGRYQKTRAIASKTLQDLGHHSAYQDIGPTPLECRLLPAKSIAMPAHAECLMASQRPGTSG